MQGKGFERAIDIMTYASHPRIHRVKEIYADANAIYLISDSLTSFYKNLMECGVLEESASTQVLNQIVKVLLTLES